jgi:hypothetical protein
MDMKKSELIAQLQAEIAANGDSEVSEATSHLTAAPLNEETQAARGQLLAEVLKLRKDSEHKDRFQTTWGSKTAIGVFATVRRIVDEGQ